MQCTPVRESAKGQSSEIRYFISSLPCDAKKILSCVRSHWKIENSLHWTLDVVFHEDASRIRKDHGPANFA
ncbi:MAG: ISAs1 family transposase, partial [Desulfovibrio sp.]|nr:ISAs1 family transposase [Desulfovibrio sp.]